MCRIRAGKVTINAFSDWACVSSSDRGLTGTKPLAHPVHEIESVRRKIDEETGRVFGRQGVFAYDRLCLSIIRAGATIFVTDEVLVKFLWIETPWDSRVRTIS